MQKFMSKPLFYVFSLLACSVMAITTGCASGGFQLTRQYARWVNSQTLILRIVLYLLTGVVFAVTLLIDMVVFNTVDFWEGRISQGTYDFKSGDKTFLVHHEVLPGSLKRSTIKVMDERKHQLQEVVLNETPSKEIEMYVDGRLRARVTDISSLPTASVFDEKGRFVEMQSLWTSNPISTASLFR